MIVFVGPGVGHLTDLVLPGEGIFESFFVRRGIFDCRLGRKRLRPNIHASRTRRMVWKDLEIMEANKNKPKVSGFHCIDQLNLLRYCGIKVNRSKEKPSRFLQVQARGGKTHKSIVKYLLQHFHIEFILQISKIFSKFLFTNAWFCQQKLCYHLRVIFQYLMGNKVVDTFLWLPVWVAQTTQKIL